MLLQLIIELENHSTDKLIIFAGYGGKKVNEKNNKMKDFLDANPGIKSRITSTIYFDSYSPDEMVQILFRIAENNHYCLDENIREMQTIVYGDIEKAIAQSEYALSVQNACQISGAIGFTAS